MCNTVLTEFIYLFIYFCSSDSFFLIIILESLFFLIFFGVIFFSCILAITKTRLFKYIENFTTKYQIKILIFFIFLFKT